jgi:hypothetical protein
MDSVSQDALLYTVLCTLEPYLHNSNTKLKLLQSLWNSTEIT